MPTFASVGFGGSWKCHTHVGNPSALMESEKILAYSTVAGSFPVVSPCRGRSREVASSSGASPSYCFTALPLSFSPVAKLLSLRRMRPLRHLLTLSASDDPPTGLRQLYLIQLDPTRQPASANPGPATKSGESEIRPLAGTVAVFHHGNTGSLRCLRTSFITLDDVNPSASNLKRRS
jgi:hypothetical protein